MQQTYYFSGFDKILPNKSPYIPRIFKVSVFMYGLKVYGYTSIFVSIFYKGR